MMCDVMLLRRFAIGAAGLAALSYSLLSLRATWLAVIGSAFAPEMSGIFPMLALSVGAVGIVLLRESFAPRRTSQSIAARVVRAFGKGWLAGVLAAVILTLNRVASTRDSSFGVGELLSDAFSYAIVVLLLAIPGLVALSVSRSRKTEP
jgi:hypothetical protein